MPVHATGGRATRQPATVSTRLQAGEELELYERRGTEGRGTSHAYQLTAVGAKLRLSLDHAGLAERYRTTEVLGKRFDEGVGEQRMGEGERGS